MKKRKGRKAHKGEPQARPRRPIASSAKGRVRHVKRVVRRTKSMTIVELVSGRQSSGTASGTRQPSKKRETAAAQAVLAPTILTVRNEDLARLGAGEAVDFIRELLWAEARRIGLSTTEINVSAAVNMPDGGIDASVVGTAAMPTDAILKPGRNSFQIKASGAFKPWRRPHLKKELFGKKHPARENLGESVHRCLEENGTYVLVCTKCDLDESRQSTAAAELKKLFATCGYNDARVEVWSQNTLVGLLHRFPSLRLKVNGRERVRFQTHRSWAQQEEMNREYKAGEPQNTIITNLTGELRAKHAAAVHIRVVGEPGIGKTRLVHEVNKGREFGGARDLLPQRKHLQG
jgi:hypothetical protein